MNDFVTGQRCISDAELRMGLGTVISVEYRTVSVLFLSTGETRTYSKQTAPLTRVAFTTGDRIVDHDGLTVTVTDVEESEGLLTYTGVDSQGSVHRIEEARLDNQLQLNRPRERLFNGQIDADKWFELRYQTQHHLNRLAHSDLFGLIGCRTSLIPHQLYIAHEVALRYAPRVLLADEVGLGKTIEAGLILHQQLLTERAQRVLIVVPETLLHQWLVEMLRRFNLHFRVFDEERCASLAGNPFFSEQLVLCSLGFLTRHEQYFEQCVQGDWDLLIVDEAHHLEWSTEYASREYQVVEQLAAKTRGVLLLTATPEQLGKQGHFARLRLLDPDRFPDYDSFIQEEKSYEPVAQVVEDLLNDKPLTQVDHETITATFNEGDNKALLDTLTKDQNDEQARIELVEHLLDRHGTGRVLYRNTRAAVKGFPGRKLFSYELDTPDEYFACLDMALQYDDTEPQWLVSPELLYQSNQTRSEHWSQIDPRIDWLVEQLTRLTGKKVLVITSSAQTALDIAEHLRKNTGIHAAVFHQGMTIVERDRAAAYFADHENGTQVLICSEIGSEGRNFQFAHHLILFDLPLNPDLLEQRIGRLDRIGQSETVNIHVPCLKNAPQAFLFRWYHEGLDAFESTCPAGPTVYVRLIDELFAAMVQPEYDREELIKTTRSIYNDLTEAMHRGRDRLLEYNSCREYIADELVQRALEQDRNASPDAYMENVFDCYGVETELHSEGCFIIRPTDNMVTRFPHLPDDGMTITYERDIALAFEDAHYITWEHPLVSDAMDMVLNNEPGNTSVTAVRYSGVPRGTLLLECLYMLEAAPIEALQTSRYLPPTTIRVVIDEKGNDHRNKLSHEAINDNKHQIDAGTSVQVIRAKQSEIKNMFERSERKAQAKEPELLAQAHSQSEQTLMREINRLKALQQVNPNIRQEEIDFFEQQLEMLNEVLDSAALRLDAVRVIVAA